MSLLVVTVLAAGLVTYVAYPLLARRGGWQPMELAVAPQTLVVHGVAYESEEEWAVERALDKAGDGKPEASAFRSEAELAIQIERQVAAVRSQLKAARARGRRPLCLNCGKVFQPGDHFCARCGSPHPHICPQCGERHRPTDAFCTRCGLALPGGEE